MSYRVEKTTRVVTDEYRVVVCDRCAATEPLDKAVPCPITLYSWTVLLPAAGDVRPEQERHFCPHCTGVVTAK